MTEASVRVPRASPSNRSQDSTTTTAIVIFLAEATILSGVTDFLTVADVLSIALSCKKVYNRLNRDGLLKVGNVSLGLAHCCQSILYSIDTSSVRRVRIYLDYYVDKTTEAECLIDGLERLTLVSELFLKFNARRMGSADLAMSISTMFSGLTRLDLICSPKDNSIQRRGTLKAESTMKSLDALMKRNKHSLLVLNLRCDPDLRVLSIPLMPRLSTLHLRGRISKSACLSIVRSTHLETFCYLREDTDPIIWATDDVDHVFHSMPLSTFRCLTLSSVRSPANLLWCMSRMLENAGILWLVRPTSIDLVDGVIYGSQIIILNIAKYSTACAALLDKISVVDDVFSVLCRLFEGVPYNAVGRLWSSDMTEKDRERWRDEVIPVIRRAIATHKAAAKLA